MRGRRFVAFAVVIPATALLVSAGWEGAWLEQDEGYGQIAPICRVATTARVIALTFDDGPNAVYTPEVLRLLVRYHDRATFFVVGRHVLGHPRLVADELARSMEIANHTWSHPNLVGLGVHELRTQLALTRDLLAGVGVPRADLELFRAPFGSVDPMVLEEAADQRMRTIGWSLVLGPQPVSPAREARMLLARIRPGAILLAHDGGAADRSYTVRLLRRLLPMLRADRITVVPVGALLARGNPVEARPGWWFWAPRLVCPR